MLQGAHLAFVFPLTCIHWMTQIVLYCKENDVGKENGNSKLNSLKILKIVAHKIFMIILLDFNLWVCFYFALTDVMRLFWKTGPLVNDDLRIWECQVAVRVKSKCLDQTSFTEKGKIILRWKSDTCLVHLMHIQV